VGVLRTYVKAKKQEERASGPGVSTKGNKMSSMGPKDGEGKGK